MDINTKLRAIPRVKTKWIANEGKEAELYALRCIIQYPTMCIRAQLHYPVCLSCSSDIPACFSQYFIISSLSSYVSSLVWLFCYKKSRFSSRISDSNSRNDCNRSNNNNTGIWVGRTSHAGALQRNVVKVMRMARTILIPLEPSCLSLKNCGSAGSCL